jgi:hypothetical protein
VSPSPQHGDFTAHRRSPRVPHSAGVAGRRAGGGGVRRRWGWGANGGCGGATVGGWRRAQEGGYPVRLAVYDLSHGWAKILSPILFCRRIPLAPHTSRSPRHRESGGQSRGGYFRVAPVFRSSQRARRAPSRQVDPHLRQRVLLGRRHPEGDAHMSCIDDSIYFPDGNAHISCIYYDIFVIRHAARHNTSALRRRTTERSPRRPFVVVGRGSRPSRDRAASHRHSCGLPHVTRPARVSPLARSLGRARRHTHDARYVSGAATHTFRRQTRRHTRKGVSGALRRDGRVAPRATATARRARVAAHALAPLSQGTLRRRGSQSGWLVGRAFSLRAERLPFRGVPFPCAVPLTPSYVALRCSSIRCRLFRSIPPPSLR